MTTVLVAVLAAAAGWCCGHATARIRHVPVGGTADQDQDAFLARERARFDELVAGLDLNVPDDPRNTA
ncbi:hypothetical protein ACFVAF_36990 [Streptomyces sp. NPDC057596]|uniref:hypothetical protein n=1 Tax=Streptomyces sp. NPDC057596 TaxID=3346178 RepID=UPI0036788559